MHIDQSPRPVLRLDELDRTQVGAVGGKGAHLGELTRIDGFAVPAGFCVTTDVFRDAVATVPALDGALDRLARLGPEERTATSTLSAEIRRAIEGAPIPGEAATAIAGALRDLGEHAACAVRSSATAEDLPSASFAGQQDSFLNVVGTAAVLEHVSRCWASLFTDRAVAYRVRHGFDHRKVSMAVVVQQMVFPDVSGVLFTADPVTSNREVVSVEATFGLGEALVAGRVNPDVFTARGGVVVGRAIAAKQLAIHAAPSGGTCEEAIEPGRQERPTLSDAQVLHLAQLGRRIEAHLGCPQDIEWCLVGDAVHIVQSRPITTLFPIPEAGDGQLHVYVSVGHQQMMTDPMKPLGLSLWQLTALRPMYHAGGRLFVDVADALAVPASRDALLDLFGRGDPLTGDALRTVAARGDLVPPPPPPPSSSSGVETSSAAAPSAPPAGAPAPIPTDPTIVTELVARTEASLDVLGHELRTRSGEELLTFILDDLRESRALLFDPRSHQAIMAGMEATWWLNDQLQAWLGERNAADVLTQSAPGNVTSEMGLALLDVADAIRPHPEVVAFLEHVEGDGFLEELPGLEGGQEAHDAFQAYLDRYGMRCVGEIDIMRPRWSERPSTLLPVLLANVRNAAPGEHARRFERGRREAEAKAQELLARLRTLPEGDAKAEETQRMIERVRTFIGYREFPKYGLIRRYGLYKQALVQEARRLLDAGVLDAVDDISFLTFPELQEVVRRGEVDRDLLQRRKEAFRTFEALTPPRVLTSEGEVVPGSYRRDDLPRGTLVGLGVSAGTVEGRARVIVDMGEAEVEPGDIVVTTHTDPSWSPLFVAISGLVTEVGGLMTHGAVIAWEYGLPAVVGVEGATRLIQDGQRIRLDGTHGSVEVID